MRVLVTGASGFVGLNVVGALLEEGVEVVAMSLDALPEEARSEFARHGDALVEETCDVRDKTALAAVCARHRIERVYHGAVITAGTAREREAPASIVETNLLGTANVLEAAHAAGVDRFVFASSSAVYGASAFSEEILREDSPQAPANLYGITKQAGERLVLRCAEVWGTDAVCGRISAVFGPWERATGLRDTLSPPFQLAVRAAQGGEAFIMKGGMRDWVYSRDVGRAFARLVLAPKPRHDVYNIGYGEPWHVADLCRRLEERFPAFAWRTADDAAQTNIAYNDDPDRRRAPLVSDRLVQDLGFSWTYDVAGALDDYAAWAAAHRDFLARQTF